MVYLLSIRISLRLFLSVVLLGLISACSSPKRADPPAVLSPLAQNQATKVIWQQQSNIKLDPQSLMQQPAIWQNQIFIATAKGQIQVYKLNNGQSVWQKDTDTPLSSSLGVADGLLVVGSQQGQLLAFNAKTGEAFWQTQLTSEVLAAPQIANNMVWVRTNDNRILAFSADEGKKRWHYESQTPVLSLRGNSAPLFKQGQIFAGFDNGELVSLDAENGQRAWSVNISQARGRTDLERMADIDGDLAWYNDNLYVSSFQGQTAALDPFDNRVLWQRDQATNLTPAVDSDAVYITTPKGHVIALDRQTGDILWQQKGLQARTVTAPVIFGQFIAVGDFEGFVHWLNLANGKLAGRYQAHKQAVRSLTTTPQGVLVIHEAGQLLLIKPA